MAEKSESSKKKGTFVIVLGMAGSGKTTVIQRIVCHLHAKNKVPYVVNLDPAVSEVPYPVNIDIRDTVNYKDVMKQYKLGPNGAIMTSLNLFTTRFDQAIRLFETRSTEHEYIIFDTPGQIEVFTWSASGGIITETLAATFPTIIVYVVDTSRCTSPITFMSNMLYACSILYKTKLPFLLAFNKIDIVDHSFAIDWMNHFDIYLDALDSETSYMVNLVRSMSLVMDEFYKGLRSVGISAVTGEGVESFFEKVNEAKIEYDEIYKTEYEKHKENIKNSQITSMGDS